VRTSAGSGDPALQLERAEQGFPACWRDRLRPVRARGAGRDGAGRTDQAERTRTRKRTRTGRQASATACSQYEHPRPRPNRIARPLRGRESFSFLVLVLRSRQSGSPDPRRRGSRRRSEERSAVSCQRSAFSTQRSATDSRPSTLVHRPSTTAPRPSTLVHRPSTPLPRPHFSTGSRLAWSSVQRTSSAVSSERASATSRMAGVSSLAASRQSSIQVVRYSHHSSSFGSWEMVA
jgi:hypothetical protein